MALTGSLLDFNAADILQLIKLQQKDGVLVVEDRGRKLSIRFKAGDVTMAERTGLGLVDALGKSLLASGCIDADGWHKAMARHKNSQTPLDQALADLDVEADVLMTPVRDYWRDTVLSLFSWAKGTYCFDLDAVMAQPIAQLPLPLDTDSILMTATTQVGALHEVIEKLEGLDNVFVVRPDGDSSGLTTEQGDVLALVDGVRTAWRIADASASSAVESYEALLALCERGVVRIEPAPKQTEAITAPMGTPAVLPVKRRRVGRGLAAGLVSLACLGTVALCAWLFISGPPMTTGGPGNELVQATWSYRDANVRKALSAYHMVNGEYPPTLATLASGGLISNPRTLSGMEYLKVGHGYTLHAD